MADATFTKAGIMDNSLFDSVSRELRVHTIVDSTCAGGCSDADCFVGARPDLRDVVTHIFF